MRSFVMIAKCLQNLANLVEFGGKGNPVRHKMRDLKKPKTKIKVPWYFGNKKTHLKFKQKEESTNYLPFSILYYCPTAHSVLNSQA